MKPIIIWLAMIPTILIAQTYETSSIPDSLKSNANAIIRFDELHVIIKDIDKAIIKHKWAITIFNEDGNKFARYLNGYNKLISLSDISGKLFDSEGKLLQKIKKKDILDLSATDEETLIDDLRMKQFTFYCKRFPYTVEFEDEEVRNGIFFLPYWQPINSEFLSLQQSKFIIETPSDYKLRYKQFNYLSQPSIETKSNSIQIYTWEQTNRPAIEGEIWQPALDELITKVVIAPTKFLIGGINGEMNSWNNLGKFLNILCKDRRELPEKMRQEVHKIADMLPTKKEKVTALYNYLQQNTRYISIQLGIGSWQPLEAKFVAEKKFGDCKALSNFMVSLLKEVGINANYVLVKAGKNETFNLKEDFPSPYFNHAIVCVPDTKDTTWLECTSQTISCGYLGSFTGNRKVLMLTDTGAIVVLTPKYRAKDNLKITNITAIINDDGTLKSEINTIYTGFKQEKIQSIFNSSTQKERDEYYNHKYDFPTYNVENISLKETKGKIPVLNEHLNIISPNYATITGKRLFIQPNLLNKEKKLTANNDRKFDIVFSDSYIDIDSIKINIPQGYRLESKPKDMKLDNKFGNYSIQYLVKDNYIELIRKCEMNEQRFPPTDYFNLTKFYEEMSIADNSNMVFVKNL